MKLVAIFQREAFSYPAYFLDILNAHAIPHRHFRLDWGEAVPSDVNGYAGFCFLGSTMSVNDDYRWVGGELGLIRAAHATGLPAVATMVRA